jgi:hypothetical protein
MKKTTSLNKWKQGESLLTPKLSQQEIEYEMDTCSQPWTCPESCYQSCIGCIRKQRGEHK